MTRPLKKILCIDDEEDILTITQMALEAVGGFTVDICSDSEQSITRIQSFKPDLLLLDYMMPGKDGPATLAEIRRHPEFNALPVVFMTARVQPSEIEEYKRMGATATIAKPFDPLTLSEDITRIWNTLSPA